MASFSGFYCSITHYTCLSMSTSITYEYTTVVYMVFFYGIVSTWDTPVWRHFAWTLPPTSNFSWAHIIASGRRLALRIATGCYPLDNRYNPERGFEPTKAQWALSTECEAHALPPSHHGWIYFDDIKISCYKIKCLESSANFISRDNS